MSCPLVSVVIPTYNRAKCIRRCIESVINQTYQNLEIIVVDDGSNDDTRQIVETYKDDRIKYLYQDNSGAQVARNKGLSVACGEFISFLDSDDEWCNNFVEESIKKLRNDNSDCVYCLSGAINDSGLLYIVRNDCLEGYIYKEALEQGYITSPTFLMVKKSCFDKIGLWDINLKACQDDDICFRLAKYFKFSLITLPLAIYHVDAEEQITTNKFRYAQGWEVLWDKHSDEVIKECGKSVLAEHYYKTAKLYADLSLFKYFYRTIFKSIKYKFCPKSIILILNFIFAAFYLYIKKIIYQKEKYNYKREITILRFIKFNYKKTRTQNM